MKTLTYLLLSILLTSCVSSSGLYYDQLTTGEKIPQSNGKLDHGQWDTLLKRYVDKEGFVDYAGFAEQRAALQDYLAYLETNAPQEGSAINEQFAYYINLYNAATIEIMLENDVPKSIKDIGSTVSPVWIQKFIKVGSNKYSLADIEKAVLQKMGDPRIHFAINCASFSCPKLQRDAFTAARVEEQMEAAAREFINSDKNDLSDPNNPKLSSIFSFYTSDFEQGGLSLVEYINQYADQKISPAAKVQFLDYDWSVNKQ